MPTIAFAVHVHQSIGHVVAASVRELRDDGPGETFVVQALGLSLCAVEEEVGIASARGF